MKYVLSVSVLALAVLGMQANADWTCTYSCGSKGQEPKVGYGWSQSQACQEAQNQICTEYVGGHPQYYQGASEDNGGGYGGGGGYREEWECTYSCGSKGQEPKLGHGRSEYEAQREAQSQLCTEYVGGYPQYYQGCNLVRR